MLKDTHQPANPLLSEEDTTFKGLSPESQGQDLALTVLYMRSFLDSGLAFFYLRIDMRVAARGLRGESFDESADSLAIKVDGQTARVERESQLPLHANFLNAPDAPHEVPKLIA